MAAYLQRRAWDEREPSFILWALWKKRLELAAAILLGLSLVLAFTLRNPAAFLGLYTENFSTFVYNLFQKNGGPLSSFYKDVAVASALMTLVVHGPGQFSRGARSPRS